MVEMVLNNIEMKKISGGGKGKRTRKGKGLKLSIFFLTY